MQKGMLEFELGLLIPFYKLINDMLPTCKLSKKENKKEREILQKKGGIKRKMADKVT